MGTISITVKTGGKNLLGVLIRLEGGFNTGQRSKAAGKNASPIKGGKPTWGEAGSAGCGDRRKMIMKSSGGKTASSGLVARKGESSTWGRLAGEESCSA